MRPPSLLPLVLALVAGLAAVTVTGPAEARRVVVLGIDGMDPVLLQRFAADGSLPSFTRLMREGSFRPLQTTAAAQSPVAWSTFITGMDPGGHGIFDFVHRDPTTMLPFLSTSRAVPPAYELGLGSFRLPLGGGTVVSLRHGRPFWAILGEHGVPTTLLRMPVSFPPSPAPLSRQLSGFGTPDLRGTPGTFTLFTARPDAQPGPVPGGEVVALDVVDGRAEGLLRGPSNPYRRPAGEGDPGGTSVPFEAWVDTASRAVRLRLGERELVMVEGEWSDFVRVEIPLLWRVVQTSALVRFQLRQVVPFLELYASPLQIDPEHPAMPISTPGEWAGELCRCLGYFYTQGMPEDAKAFMHGALDGRGFAAQLDLNLDETRRLHAHLREEHRDGFLFVYYGTLDLGCHMLWHYSDPQHPAFVADQELAGGIRHLYQRLDEVLGEVLADLDAETTLIVLSDHGFAPFYRAVNLNTWLLEQGYAALRQGATQNGQALFGDVDWARTRAYALGLNGLYVNRLGREREGVVADGAEYERLVDELEERLLDWRDPATGQAVVTRVTRPCRDFVGPHRGEGPDLLVGYNRGYRSSWESPLGEFPAGVLRDNESRWSGDHCMDHAQVPGVLLSNREITLDAPALQDVTAAILDEWKIPLAPGMIGRDCLGDREGAARGPGQ